ncbi:MAG TPA: AraC family transcriptional regulator [Gaiellaceae bacterium]
MQAHTIDRRLLETDRLVVGEFWCPPQSRCWDGLNSVSAVPHVVFPRTPVTIRQLGREPVVCDRNHVLFFNPGQRFFRSLRSRDGDRSYYVELKPELMFRLGGLATFPFAFGPCDPGVFLLQRLAVRHLREPNPDSQLVEECVTEAVSQALTRARAFHGLRAHGREATRAAHREIVDQTKELLAARFREHLTMGEIAGAIGVSRFHLSRVFRSCTGFSLHGYRNQLRLRAAVERLVDPQTILPPLAAELGFSSHSHFTAAFREAFGIAPSELRGRIGRARLEGVLAIQGAARNVPFSAASGCD